MLEKDVSGCEGGRWTCRLTNQNEGHRDKEREDIATNWLIILADSFCKEVQNLIDVVFTQSLERES